jgi:exodeoxyribonuclease V beta subunit
VVPIGSFSGQTRQNSNYPALFHQEDEQGRIQVCAELGQNDAHRKVAIQESREEDMRLLYVALTRAKSRCLIGLPIVRGFQNTAMARLLGLSEAKLDADQVQQHLENSLEGMATVKKVQSVASSQLIQSQQLSAVIPPKPMPLIQDQWQIHSYTGITRTLEHRQGNRELPQGFTDDDPPAADPLYQSLSDPSRQNGEVFASQDPENNGYNRFNFDRGPRIGVALHSLMEKINFQASPEALTRACQQLLQQLDLNPDQWLKPTLAWLQDMLSTPLSDSAFSLQDIALIDRLDELEFHFPVSSGQALISACQHHGYLQGYHAETLALEGMMTGKIDLICRHKGQYYIIDYKSNFLGYRQTDYAENALRSSILQHQYDLQYLIYSVALKKFLSSRLPGKDFETLYGGIYYLFLRGMNGKASSGVFADRPSTALLRALELVLEPEAC